LGNTTKEETHDDPMDIDYTGKFNGKGKQNRRINKTQKYDSNNKEHERNTKKGKEEKDKYCYICDMNNHDTKECYFNPKNPNSKFNKYYNENKKGNNENYNRNKKYNSKRYIGYVSDANLNNEYNYEVNFDQIRPYLDKPSTSNDQNTSENMKSTCLINFCDKNYELSNNNEEKVNNNSCINSKQSEIKVPRVTEYLNSLNNILHINEDEKTQWLYDSGAGEHITNNKNILKNFINDPVTLKCQCNES